MLMVVIKLIKDSLFLDTYLRPKYEFVLNYYFFTLIITTTDSEIFSGRGEGVGWEGKTIYVFSWIVRA